MPDPEIPPYAESLAEVARLLDVPQDQVLTRLGALRDDPDPVTGVHASNTRRWLRLAAETPEGNPRERDALGCWARTEARRMAERMARPSA
jgi:hypothetical protein